MAKTKPALNIFARTATPTAAATPTAEKAISWGVSLQSGEWAEIEKIAAELNMKRGQLAVSLIRYGLKAYKEGKIKTKTAKTLDI